VALRTVLVLDDDLGFCMWLGCALNQAGIRALPACDTEEALEIGSDPSSTVALIIINPRIEGSRKVVEKYPNAKLIAIGGAGKLAVDATIRRPRGKTIPPPERFLRIVRKVLGLRP